MNDPKRTTMPTMAAEAINYLEAAICAKEKTKDDQEAERCLTEAEAWIAKARAALKTPQP